MPLCEILDALHQHNIIHKDINPASIFIHPATGQVKLTNFGIASQASRELCPGSPNLLEDALAYLAPEQTGRMNRAG